VLTVRAMDGDRGIRNKIKYGILNGNSQLFGINPQTGLIYTKVIINSGIQGAARPSFNICKLTK